MPAAPLVMVIHGAPIDVVHAQPGPVLTATVPVRAADVIDRLFGEMLNAQPPACVIENVWPAMVTDPVRAEVSVFADTE